MKEKNEYEAIAETAEKKKKSNNETKAKSAKVNNKHAI